jgi:hypothetical protein
MTYIDRLQAKLLENASPSKPSKLTKSSTVNFETEGREAVRSSKQLIAPRIITELNALKSAPAPLYAQSTIWSQVVSDAWQLLVSGRAEEAVELGWHPLHLWGCTPLLQGHDAFDGLAVRLLGRGPLIFRTHAIMRSGPTVHSVFTPSSIGGAVFLWDLIAADPGGVLSAR